MRWIFDWIVDFMEENGSIDYKYRDVYVYAVQTVFAYIFNILSGVAIGIAMGEVLPCILFLIAVIPLREHAGGYHASGWVSCYFLSCMVLVLALMWGKINFTGRSHMTLTAAMLAGAYVFGEAPLEDENKPLEEDEKKRIGKKAKIIVCMEIITGTMLLYWERKFAYAVLSAVNWCGIGLLTWHVKKKCVKK